MQPWKRSLTFAFIYVMYSIVSFGYFAYYVQYYRMHNCIVYLVYFLVALCCIVYIRHNDLNFFHYNSNIIYASREPI